MEWKDEEEPSPDFYSSKTFVVLFLICVIVCSIGYFLTEQEEEPHSWNGGAHSLSTQI